MGPCALWAGILQGTLLNQGSIDVIHTAPSCHTHASQASLNFTGMVLCY